MSKDEIIEAIEQLTLKGDAAKTYTELSAIKRRIDELLDACDFALNDMDG